MATTGGTRAQKVEYMAGTYSASPSWAASTVIAQAKAIKSDVAIRPNTFFFVRYIIRLLFSFCYAGLPAFEHKNTTNSHSPAETRLWCKF
jgi:hypothetical protein